MAEGVVRRLRLLGADAVDFEAFAGCAMTADAFGRPSNRKAGMWILWFLLRSIESNPSAFDEKFLDVWPVTSRPQERQFVNVALSHLTWLESTRVLPPKSTRRSAVEAFAGEHFSALTKRLGRLALSRLIPEQPQPASRWDGTHDVEAQIEEITRQAKELLGDRRESKISRDRARVDLHERLAEIREMRQKIRSRRAYIAANIARYVGPVDHTAWSETHREAYAGLEELSRNVSGHQPIAHKARVLLQEGVPQFSLTHIDGGRLGRRNIEYLTNDGTFDLISMLQRRTRFLEALTVTYERIQRTRESPTSVSFDCLNSLRRSLDESIQVTSSLLQGTDTARRATAQEAAQYRSRLKDLESGLNNALQCSPAPPPKTPAIPTLLPSPPPNDSSTSAVSIAGARTVTKQLRKAVRMLDDETPLKLNPPVFAARSTAKRRTLTSAIRHTPLRVSNHVSVENGHTIEKSVRFASPSYQPVTPPPMSVRDSNDSLGDSATPKKRLFETPTPASTSSSEQLSALKVDSHLPLLASLPLADENADPEMLGDLSLPVLDVGSGSRSSQLSMAMSDDEFLEVSRAAYAIVAGLENQ